MPLKSLQWFPTTCRIKIKFQTRAKSHSSLILILFFSHTSYHTFSYSGQPPQNTVKVFYSVVPLLMFPLLGICFPVYIYPNQVDMFSICSSGSDLSTPPAQCTGRLTCMDYINGLSCFLAAD